MRAFLIPLGSLITAIWLSVVPLTVAASADQRIRLAESEDLDAWFEDDWEERLRAVNEGELEFLETPPDRRALTTKNRLELTPQSLTSGWVVLAQCQLDLDPLPAVEIVYRYEGMRGLRIASSRGIGSAWVEGNTVQLADVSPGAEICIRAEVRILTATPDGGFEIRSGPFHRRFLDGYYPVHLEYIVAYPADLLMIESVTPSPQPGLSVSRRPGIFSIDVWFEGKLTLVLRLRDIKASH